MAQHRTRVRRRADALPTPCQATIHAAHWRIQQSRLIINRWPVTTAQAGKGSCSGGGQQHCRAAGPTCASGVCIDDDAPGEQVHSRPQMQQSQHPRQRGCRLWWLSAARVAVRHDGASHTEGAAVCGRRRADDCANSEPIQGAGQRCCLPSALLGALRPLVAIGRREEQRHTHLRCQQWGDGIGARATLWRGRQRWRPRMAAGLGTVALPRRRGRYTQTDSRGSVRRLLRGRVRWILLQASPPRRLGRVLLSPRPRADDGHLVRLLRRVRRSVSQEEGEGPSGAGRGSRAEPEDGARRSHGHARRAASTGPRSPRGLDPRGADIR
jgi:hypothetical protein